jgi:hypothetical protein
LAPDWIGTTLKVPLHRLRSVDGRTATLLYVTLPTHARNRGRRCRGAARQPGRHCLARDGKTGQPRGNGRSCSRDPPELRASESSDTADGRSGPCPPEVTQSAASEQPTSRSIASFRVAVTERAKCGQWTTTASNTDRLTKPDYTRSVRQRPAAASTAMPGRIGPGRRPACRRKERRFE